ncbi:MAG: hypothetical protein MZW92_45580 [Comamonadaceae bacterium]|nr:hypothetical protein [Comamonadaceae bacterium]
MRGRGAGAPASSARPTRRQQARGVVELIMMIGEPLAQDRVYDFAASDLFQRSLRGRPGAVLRRRLLAARRRRTSPFLQRKMVGIFMLCTRLKARVNLARLFGEQFRPARRRHYRTAPAPPAALASRAGRRRPVVFRHGPSTGRPVPGRLAAEPGARRSAIR